MPIIKSNANRQLKTAGIVTLGDLPIVQAYLGSTLVYNGRIKAPKGCVVNPYMWVQESDRTEFDGITVPRYSQSGWKDAYDHVDNLIFYAVWLYSNTQYRFGMTDGGLYLCPYMALYTKDLQLEWETRTVDDGNPYIDSIEMQATHTYQPVTDGWYLFVIGVPPSVTENLGAGQDENTYVVSGHIYPAPTPPWPGGTDCHTIREWVASGSYPTGVVVSGYPPNGPDDEPVNGTYAVTNDQYHRYFERHANGNTYRVTFTPYGSGAGELGNEWWKLQLVDIVMGWEFIERLEFTMKQVDYSRYVKDDPRWHLIYWNNASDIPWSITYRSEGNGPAFENLTVTLLGVQNGHWITRYM